MRATLGALGLDGQSAWFIAVPTQREIISFADASPRTPTKKPALRRVLYFERLYRGINR